MSGLVKLRCSVGDGDGRQVWAGRARSRVRSPRLCKARFLRKADARAVTERWMDSRGDLGNFYVRCRERVVFGVNIQICIVGICDPGYSCR